MSRKTFFLLGLLTLFGFTAVGGLIIEQFLDVRFFSLFQDKMSFHIQVLAGLGYGLATALLGWKIVTTTLLTETKNFFSSLIQGLNLSIWDILFISFCAGTGEEILFRGAIQPLLGVWITAIVFVAIHGYINPKNWRLSIYGVYMCFVIAGLGYMCEYMGIVSAIAGHFMIDVVLLLALNKVPTEKSDEEY